MHQGARRDEAEPPLDPRQDGIEQVVTQVEQYGQLAVTLEQILAAAVRIAPAGPESITETLSFMPQQ
jgi:hypothetical protein